MNEREYDELMRKSLTNSIYWQGVTATKGDARQAKEWLTKTQNRLTADFRIKKSEWGAMAATLTYQSVRFREELARYKTWEARALRFQSMVQARLAELQEEAAASRGPGKPKPDALEKAHAHGEYMHKQMRHQHDSLMALARAVLAFSNGDTTTRDLVENLDILTIPHNGDGQQTLREALLAIARSREAS